MKYSVQENIAKKVVFIDGVTRCGKSLLTNILPSLDPVEHIQFFTLIEQILPGVAHGVVDLSYARSFVRTMMNENIYNMRLGRSVNFRYDDQSGIMNYKYPKVYFRRLGEAEGDSIVKDLRRAKAYFPFQTHDAMVHLDILTKLEIDFFMIELFRNPIDNIYSWWTRGWGERFGNDPRAFTLTMECNGVKLPWHCKGLERKWISANPMERCIIAAVDLIRKSVEQYRGASKRERILLMRFEDFVAFPDKEVGRICQFLDVCPTDLTPWFIHQARCPRLIDLKARQRKFAKFKRGVRPTILKQLLELTDHYESSFYDLERK